MTDFVVYSFWGETPIGMQRVVFETVTRLVQQQSLLCFSTYRGEYWDLTTLLRQPGLRIDDLIMAARLHYSSLSGKFMPFARCLRRLRRLRRPPPLRPRDGVLLLGAWWEMPTAYERCRQARRLGLPIMVLVYDLIPLLHRELTGYAFGDAFKKLLTLPMHVVSISQFTRKEFEIARREEGIAEPLHFDVVPLAHALPGVPRNDRSAKLPPDLAACLSRPFVLCVGTVEIRKNHLTLLDAWERLASMREDLPTLVVAGKRGWKADAALVRMESQPGVLFVEGPDDAALRALYANCLFTVFASILEGWGLPVGESLWFGKACAASRATTIPEVGQQLCTYFDPQDTETMVAAIETLLDAKQRAAAETMIRNAPLRTWGDVGSDLAHLIETISKQGEGGPCRVPDAMATE